MNWKFIAPIQLLVILSAAPLSSQTPVDVIETTLKVTIMGEEIFYLGFAEGDKVIFNFEEANGKELKEVEIVELPGTSRYLELKISKIVNKTLTQLLLQDFVNTRSKEYQQMHLCKTLIQLFLLIL